jgi:DNA-binding transcriptional ArsR family regulator
MLVRMATTFAVLAGPTRRRILDALAVAERRVGEPVDVTARSRLAVSTHLRVRRRAGLAEVPADAQRRAYPGRSERVHAADWWLVPNRRGWASPLGALDRRLGGGDDGRTPVEERAHGPR